MYSGEKVNWKRERRGDESSGGRQNQRKNNHPTQVALNPRPREKNNDNARVFLLLLNGKKGSIKPRNFEKQKEKGENGKGEEHALGQSLP